MCFAILYLVSILYVVILRNDSSVMIRIINEHCMLLLWLCVVLCMSLFVFVG